LALPLLFCSLDWADETDLVWSTFLGGNSCERSHAIDFDALSNVYVIGQTGSADFPTTTGAFDTTLNGDQDVFVVKLNPAGSALDYATFLGGSSDDYGCDIVLDDSGNAHLTGYTKSADFPVTAGAFDSTHNGDEDVFVAKFNATGCALSYSTFLGGSGGDKGLGIAIDSSGNVYTVGTTGSDDFPCTAGVFDATPNGAEDVFVAKLDPTGSALGYASLLGGSKRDNGHDIAVDGFGNAYVIGVTLSDDFPTTAGAFDSTHNGNEDVFVAKFNATGCALSYSTFLGGGSFDKGFGVAVDDSGYAHVTGYTKSADFPTTSGVFDTTYNGGWDVFVAKLDTTGSALHYATFVGGSNYEKGFDIALDHSGNAHVTGYTLSEDFPITPGALDDTQDGREDVYVAKLNTRGTALMYATYLGGSDYEGGHGIAVDGAGDVYITGDTWSADFPTTAGAYKTTISGRHSDAFVAKLNLGGAR
jgi:hypothetical protein